MKEILVSCDDDIQSVGAETTRLLAHRKGLADLVPTDGLLEKFGCRCNAPFFFFLYRRGRGQNLG